jgi:hypothetical protein
MEFASYQLRDLLAVPVSASLALSCYLVRMRAGDCSVSVPVSGDDPKLDGSTALRRSTFPHNHTSDDLRRAITSEAMALVAQSAARAKIRREPIPFPASLNLRQSAEAASEAPQSVDTTYMQIPAVNTKSISTQAVEPSRNRAITEAPASAPGSEPRPQRNWAELLAQHRPADRIVASATVIAALASESRRTQHPQAASTLPSPKSERGAAAKSWEHVQAHVFAEIPLPTGIHDGYILSRLVESRRPISGLVVSIGISAAKEQAPGAAHRESAPAAVRTLIRSLLGPHDFAAASAPDEYLLIFPQERGAAAQRRLAEIAQKLWDFQLRMLGQAAILFSWGGVEVRGESIDEAIQSASDRMQETRRTRSAKALEKHGLRIAG